MGLRLHSWSFMRAGKQRARDRRMKRQVQKVTGVLAAAQTPESNILQITPHPILYSNGNGTCECMCGKRAAEGALASRRQQQPPC